MWRRPPSLKPSPADRANEQNVENLLIIKDKWLAETATWTEHAGLSEKCGEVDSAVNELNCARSAQTTGSVGVWHGYGKRVWQGFFCHTPAIPSK
jgi:hypothetical protein